MKIWIGHGTEHSANLVMIGHFKTVDAAEKVERLIQQLREQVAASGDDFFNAHDPYTFPIDGDIRKTISEAGVYSLSAVDVASFAMDFSVTREGADIRLHTEEHEIVGFVKALIDCGAKVEVFSKHDHSEGEDSEQKNEH